MRIHCKYAGIKGFINLYEYALRYSYMITDKAKDRAKILSFWAKHGLEATIDAFPVKRSTLFLWRKKLKDNQGKLEALNDKSKSPQRRRQRIIDKRIEQFVIIQRTEHPRIGKEKLKPLLNDYCLKENIVSISESTIGRLIANLKERRLIPSNAKAYLSGRTGRIIVRNPAKKRQKIRRKNYQPAKAGDLLQIDTIEKFINGVRRYIITAIDLKSDFAFAYGYPAASSLNTKDFFKKLTQVAPFKIFRIQTDNGSEFEKYFREYVVQEKIIHFHNYPKCPKMNAYIERFNRTIQEEFINWHRQLLSGSLEAFNRKLIDWLLWYNTKRPHWSLGLKSPLQYIVDQLTPEKSNMLWTDTIALQIISEIVIYDKNGPIV